LYVHIFEIVYGYGLIYMDSPTVHRSFYCPSHLLGRQGGLRLDKCGEDQDVFTRPAHAICFIVHPPCRYSSLTKYLPTRNSINTPVAPLWPDIFHRCSARSMLHKKGVRKKNEPKVWHKCAAVACLMMRYHRSPIPVNASKERWIAFANTGIK
jgi:hypothetical protein